MDSYLACLAEEIMAHLLEVYEELKMMFMKHFYWQYHGINIFF